MKSKVLVLIESVILLIVILSASNKIQTAEGITVWNITTVDDVGDVGYFSSIALDSNDFPHISYYDDTNRVLKYAYFDGTIWHTTIVDDIGSVGKYSSIALDSDDNPHICYRDGTNYALKYAYFNGVSWEKVLVDSGDVKYSSIALDSNDQPHICFCESVFDYLKYAYFDGTIWHTTIVDDIGNIKKYSSIALDSNDYPHISYHDLVENQLKYTYFNGLNWNVVTTSISGGYGTSIDVDSKDFVHISAVMTSNLFHFLSDGYNLYASGIDTNVYWCSTSIALDSSDLAHISYQGVRSEGSDLKYCFYENSDWHISIVDTGSSEYSVGFNSSIALDKSDTPHISYYDYDNGDLKYAYLYTVPTYSLDILVSSGGTTDPIPDSYSYNEGSEIEVFAVAEDYYLFDHWDFDGDDAGKDNPIKVVMDSNHVLTALFKPRGYSVKVTGEFDYLEKERVKIRLATLVNDEITGEPSSDLTVKLSIFDEEGSVLISDLMEERILESGIYEWFSDRDIKELDNQIGLEKGVYLVHVQVFIDELVVASDILEFHIDPPATESLSIQSISLIICVVALLILGTLWYLDHKNQTKKIDHVCMV